MRWRYLGGRVAQAVVVVWAAFTLSFLILYLLPGDPVALMLNPGGQAQYVDPAQAAALRAELGFDRPTVVQYGERLVAALQGDFGRSISTGRPVTATIVDALPSTLALAGLGLGVGLVGGTGLALLATYLRRPFLRESLLSLPPLGIAVPTFWVGLMLLQVFSFQLAWFPAFGNEGFRSLVLPALTLALPTGAIVAQILASSLLATWRQPFVAIVRAKGVDRRRTHLGPVFQNAAIPTVTIAGLIVGASVAGSVVVETVFSRSGIGRLMQTAVADRDIPLVQGLVVLSAVVFVIISFVIDLLYPLLDPRIGAGRRARS